MTAHPITEELLTEAAAVARIPGRDADVRARIRGLGIARRGATGVRPAGWAAGFLWPRCEFWLRVI